MDPEMQALREQSQAMARQGAGFRAGLVGTPATYAGRSLCVSRTSLGHRRDIEPGGFEFQPEAVVRVDRAAHAWFLPTEAAAKAAVGQPLILEGITLKIVEARLLAAEVLLTLGKP